MRNEEDEVLGLDQPLLTEYCSEDGEVKDMAIRVWAETKKLCSIVGPAIFSRVATYTMNIISQAFSGHIGEVELAAFAIANTVIAGFNYGLLVI